MALSIQITSSIDAWENTYPQWADYYTGSVLAETSREKEELRLLTLTGMGTWIFLLGKRKIPLPLWNADGAR